MFRNANGDIKLFIDKRCKHTIISFEQLMYKEHSRDVDKRQNIDHCGDAAGYAIEYNFPSKTRHITGISL